LRWRAALQSPDTAGQLTFSCRLLVCLAEMNAPAAPTNGQQQLG
mgnify:CR=1